LKNIGEDVSLNNENLRCCGNCKNFIFDPHGTIDCLENAGTCDPAALCGKWSFDVQNWIDRRIDKEEP